MATASTQMSSTGVRLAGLVALVALASLALVAVGMADGTWRPTQPVATLTRFLDAFSWLGNGAAALVALHAVLRPKSTGWLAHAAVRGAVAAWLAVLLVAWNMTLQTLSVPDGLQLWGVVGLAFLVPLLYLGWWGFCVPHGGLRFRHAAAWTVPPMVLWLGFDPGVLRALARVPGMLAIPMLVLGVGGLLVVIDRKLGAR